MDLSDQSITIGKKLTNILSKKLINRSVIIIIFLSLTYSTSYQQFRHFNIENPRGFSDTRSYIKMSKDNYKVSQTHRYRFLIPKAVSLLQPVIGNFNSSDISSINETKANENLKMRFWVVNLFFTTLTAYILFIFQQLIGLNQIGSFLGSLIFITSRSTIANTGIPIIDAGQNFGIMLLIYLIHLKDVLKISFALPFIILLKETLYPLVFIPLLKKHFRKYPVILSLIFALSLAIISRDYINNISLDTDVERITLIDNLIIHASKLINNITDLSFRRLHNLIFFSYSFFLASSFIGYLINLKEKVIKISSESYLLIPYCMAISFLVAAPGKILFMTFPIVIPFSIIFLSKIFNFELKQSDYQNN